MNGWSMTLIVLSISCFVMGEVLHGKDIGRQGIGRWPFTLRDHLAFLGVVLLIVATILCYVEGSRKSTKRLPSRSASRQAIKVVAINPRFTGH